MRCGAAIALCTGLACAELPTERVAVSWDVGRGLACRDLPGERVEVHAGELGVVAHGPCSGAAELTLSHGRWGLRALLYDRSDQLLAIAETEVEVGPEGGSAGLVMQPLEGLRGSVWLRPHAGGLSGCAIHNIAAYQVRLARPWGVVETRRMGCEGVGDLLVEHLLPGAWSVELEALSPSGAAHGRARIDLAVPPRGLVSAAPDRPLLVGLSERHTPAGRMQVLFARLDSSAADCSVTGVDRLRLSVRRGGREPVDFDLACTDPLPRWSEISDGSAAIGVAADALLDGRVLYNGSWNFLLSPAFQPDALIMEPTP
jgi:hypothetical protein